MARDPPKNATGKAWFYLGSKLHLPAHAYLFGLNAVADHNAGGHRIQPEQVSVRRQVKLRPQVEQNLDRKSVV